MRRLVQFFYLSLQGKKDRLTVNADMSASMRRISRLPLIVRVDDTLRDQHCPARDRWV